ncbi:DUF4190 domain-containing protein [Microbacterium sp. P07]|uniref:DUF4190 domain-containing protein n=1 Tax=Microbacterium sp. P07 TaxID=3366952 RepID=UPI003746F68D
MSDENPNGSPAGTPASPPTPGYPGAEQPPYATPAYTPSAYNPGGDQAPYGSPAYPQQPQQYGYAGGYGYPPKTNALAIIALISGIAAFVVLPFIASIVAVITGHMSLKQIKTSGEGGRGMALTGTILGWVGIGLAVIGIVFVILWVIVVVGVASSSSTNYDYS